jgi:hypothetical protein
MDVVHHAVSKKCGNVHTTRRRNALTVKSLVETDFGTLLRNATMAMGGIAMGVHLHAAMNLATLVSAVRTWVRHNVRPPVVMATRCSVKSVMTRTLSAEMDVMLPAKWNRCISALEPRRT